MGWVGWLVWVGGLPAYVSRPERPKGAKDEVGARRALRLLVLYINFIIFPGGLRDGCWSVLWGSQLPVAGQRWIPAQQGKAGWTSGR